MVEEIILREAGESVTASLPREMAEQLHIGPGDRLFAVKTNNGVLLTPFNPDLRDATQAFDKAHRQDRNTLKKLAEGAVSLAGGDDLSSAPISGRARTCHA